MDDLLWTTAERAIRYVGELPERRVAPDAVALAGLGRFDVPLPDGPDDPGHVIAVLDEVGSPATVATAGPRFFGFVIGGSHPVSVAANWLAAAWDQNAHSFTSSPVAAALEQVAQRWMVELLNQVLVSFGDDEATRRAVAAIQEDGTCWAGVTV